MSRYRRDSRRRPPVTLSPTSPAEALGLRLTLERPVTVQAPQVTRTLGPGIDRAKRFPTFEVHHVPIGQTAVRTEDDRACANRAHRVGRGPLRRRNRGL